MFWIASSKDRILDASGSEVVSYPGVTEVLQDLHEQGFILAVASRTGEIKGARQLLELFGWNKYFYHKEIFPGCKVTHITKYT